MDNIIYEILNEYTMTVEGLDFDIKGRVVKEINGVTGSSYRWEISHYCKPSKNAATVYIPSTVSADTYKKAKDLLFMYMEPFTNIAVEPNKYY